jgi:hypothetical protein
MTGRLFPDKVNIKRLASFNPQKSRRGASPHYLAMLDDLPALPFINPVVPHPTTRFERVRFSKIAQWEFCLDDAGNNGSANGVPQRRITTAAAITPAIAMVTTVINAHCLVRTLWKAW